MKQFVKTVKCELDEDEKRLFQELNMEGESLNDDAAKVPNDSKLVEAIQKLKERESVCSSKGKAWWKSVQENHHFNNYDTIFHTDGLVVYIYEVADPAAEAMERLTGKKLEPSQRMPYPPTPPFPGMASF